jgi:hypothetical protein
MFLSLKTLSFLYNHSDQITTNAPTVIIILNLRPTPFCQLSNMLAMLHIGYMVKPIWMSDHMDLASLTLKNKWLIVSSWCRRHTLYFHVNCVSQGCIYWGLHIYEYTTQKSYNSAESSFSNLLLLSTYTFGWINVLYMEYTKNLPISGRFHRNSWVSCVNWTKFRRCIKAFHDASLGPTRFLLNVTFGGEVFNNLAILSLFLIHNIVKLDIVLGVALPSHLSLITLFSSHP